MKNDSVRSCLIELQSFLQSKIDVDPIYRVLMFLPCFVNDAVHSSAMTRFIQGIHKQKEYCLSVAQILTSRYQSRIDDGMQIERTSDMINVPEEAARNNNIVLVK